MSNNEIEAALQYMLELLYSQASDHLSSADHFQQQHDVEDAEVTLDVKEMIQDCGDGASLRECCIYKVPHTLRRSDQKEDAYTPLVVSVGPIHYNQKRLRKMEMHKKNMLQKFIDETESSRDDLFCLVQRLEPEVRNSYSELINLNELQLAELTLRDAGYIIQLFIMNYKRDAVGNDAKLLGPSLVPSVFKDLLLLENQLPFFVIEQLFNTLSKKKKEQLFNKAFPHKSRDSPPSFLELTYYYFQRLNVEKLKPNDDVKINHFTDLLRFFYLQGKIPTRQRLTPETPEAGRNILQYNANKLQEKGIKLKASDSYCLLDMKFSSNILEIPQLLVVGSTRRLFCNMIALEQCHYHDQAYISDYAHILDCLIDTDKDVDLLVSKKIVRNHFGDSDSVASLFNRLGENATLWDFNSEYLDICKKLNDNFQDRWTGMKATLRRDYCRTPWQIVVSIAGIVVILLTVVQTITSILQVGK